MNRNVELKTDDGIKIAGDYYPASGDRGIVLLHMMPADRTSWATFAEKLQTAGFQALAIDLRGHGASQGGPDGYKNFFDAEHQASRSDVVAAADFLKSKGVAKIFLAGASIGANLALEYAAAHSDARAVILLSPGFDYRGVTTEGLIARLAPEQGVYAAASEEDSYSADSVRRIFEHIQPGPGRMTKFFHDAGHGTAIFDRDPALTDEFVSWLGHF